MKSVHEFLSEGIESSGMESIELVRQAREKLPGSARGHLAGLLRELLNLINIRKTSKPQ